jgi:hypothetical protein
MHSLRFSKKCRAHCKGRERDGVDELRLQWLERNLLRNWNARTRANIESRIAKIYRRRLHRVWLTRPAIEGSTLELSERDDLRVANWLREVQAVDVESDEHTPRCRDRLRWAAVLFLSGRRDGETVRRRIVSALRDDQKWRLRQDQ